VSVLCLLAITREARAIDARSVGLANTGTAYIDSGAAIYFNPALMQQTQSYAATLAFGGTSAVSRGPVDGPNTSVSSSGAPSPAFLAGASYRLNDRFVVGLAMYPTLGLGADYRKVTSLSGGELKTTAYALEVSPAVSFAITDALSVAIGYRATVAALDTVQSSPGQTQETSVSGTNWLGVQAGAFYRPIPPLRLGLQYKALVTDDLSGHTTVTGSMTGSTTGSTPIPTTSSLSIPHALRAGVALSLLDDALLLVVEGGWTLFSSSWRELVVTQQPPHAAPSTNTEVLDWIDALVFQAAAEYRVHARVPVRIGYEIERSQTSPQSAYYFFLPPGVVQAVHAGAGFLLPHWSIDLGGYYEFGGQQADGTKLGNPGYYGIHGAAAVLSATLHG
jgi:long-subunit fatty acid transport protein